MTNDDSHTPSSKELPAQMVCRFIDAAVHRIDLIAGVQPGSRPAHLGQFNAVLELVVTQVRQAERDDVAAADPDLELWRLREPGYLRAICDYPVARPSGVLVLLPVALTWAILGWAEVRYAERYAASDVTARPSFFAEWIAAPGLQGPVLLSVVIVLSVLWIMATYGRAARAQQRADDIDRTVQGLEVDLFAPLTQLRARAVPTTADVHTRRAADALFHVSVRFGDAAAQLAAAQPLVVRLGVVIDRLGIVIDRLVSAMPDLERQASQLVSVDERLRGTAREVAEQMRPVTEIVAGSAAAADAARDAVTRSASALAAADEQLATAKRVSEQSAEHRSSLHEAQRPFTAAAEQLDTTAAALHELVGTLKETIREVNWLAMVSDGLRYSDQNHGDQNHRPPATGSPPPNPEASVT
jgi:hypothetical protein